MSLNAEEIRHNFKEKKNSIVALLGEAASFYQNQDDMEKKQVFDKLAGDVENGEFSIVVVGEFSAGKSTLLNALMGNRMLPSYKSETTATVNFLSHKNKQTDGYPGKVFYKDGTSKGIADTTLDTITKYVSTRGENIASTVKYLELYLDSKFLEDGVTLVDSPGLNGIAEGHKEITQQQILKSHASIFVFSGDHPGTETEFSFLGELSEKVKTIFLVMNKIDDIHEDEGETPESVVQILRENYKRKFPNVTKVPEIWPVAALPALVARSREKVDYRGRSDWSADEKKELLTKSLLENFEARLLRFLTQGEKTRAELLAPVQKVIDVVSESRDYLEKEKAAVEGSLDASDLNDEMMALEESKAKFEEKLADSKRDIKKALQEEFDKTEEEFMANITRFKDSKVKHMEDFDDLEDVKDFCDNLGTDFARRIYNFARDADEKMRESVRYVVLMQFDKYADSIDADIHDVSHIDLKIDSREQLAIDIVDFGLEAMNERRKKAEAELEALEKEKRIAEKDMRKTRRLETEQERIKAEISNLEEQRKTIRFQLAQGLPPVERYNKTVTIEQERNGVFGDIAQFFVGKKKIDRTVSEVDATARNEAKQRLETEDRAILKELEAKKAELREKCSDSIEDAESRQEEMSAAVNALREKLAKQEREDKEEIQKKHAKEIKKIQRKVEEYCDSVSDSISSAVKKEFRKAKDAYVELIYCKVADDLNKSMDREKKKIESLQAKMDSAAADRDGQIAELTTKIDCAEAILAKAVEMESNIKAEDVDVISEDNI